MKFLYRVLYMCEENIDKSQIAAAYHRSIGGIADSAGIHVSRKRLLLTLDSIPEAKNIVSVMKEENIDISLARPRRLTLPLLNLFDKIICMAERNYCQNYLVDNRIVEFWNIEDAKGKDLETTQKIRDEIKQKIDEESQKW